MAFIHLNLYCNILALYMCVKYHFNFYISITSVLDYTFCNISIHHAKIRNNTSISDTSVSTSSSLEVSSELDSLLSLSCKLSSETSSESLEMSSEEEDSSASLLLLIPLSFMLMTRGVTASFCIPSFFQ